MKKDNESIEARLIRSMEQAVAISKGRAKAKQSYTLPLTASEVSVAPARAMTKSEIAKIRNRLNSSQKVFADVLNVSIGTVRSWEQGLRVPEGPSKRLLEVAYRYPEILLETAKVGEPSRRKTRAPKRRSASAERRSGRDRRGTVHKKAARAR